MNDSPTNPQDSAPPAEAPAEPTPIQPKPSTSLDRELADMKDRLLRTLAEMENLRQRTQREGGDARTYGVTSFARDILTVADNMHRALASLDGELRAKADAGMNALLD